MPETWTPDRIEQLKAHVAAGLSCGAIARKLDLSRSAVIGKINRLRVARGNPLITARKPRPRKASTKLADVTAVVEPEEILPAEVVETPASGLFALVDLEPWQCKYPIGDALPYRFCGAQSVQGCSYCAEHIPVVFVVPPRRVKE
jgi:GcrA cell cycle regulator